MTPDAVRYHTIVADPPWNEEGGGRIKRGASRHYKLLKTEDIIGLMWDTLVLGERLEDNAHLYLWVTNNFLPDGLRVLAALQFRYVTTITWFKDRFGLGQYYRGITEHCLFGVNGVLPYRTRPDGKRAQGVTGFFAPRTEHSEKPSQLQDMAELVSPPPYLEMFARKQRPGWDYWGLETQGTILKAVAGENPAYHLTTGAGLFRTEQGFERGGLRSQPMPQRNQRQDYENAPPLL